MYQTYQYGHFIFKSLKFEIFSSLCTFTRICMYIFVCVCVHIVQVCVYVCVCVYACLCTYIHVHSHLLRLGPNYLSLLTTLAQANLCGRKSVFRLHDSEFSPYVTSWSGVFYSTLVRTKDFQLDFVDESWKKFTDVEAIRMSMMYLMMMLSSMDAMTFCSVCVCVLLL